MIQIKKAEHVGGTKVRVHFSDGTHGVVDLKGEIGKGKKQAEVRAMLENVTVEGNSVFFESEPNSHFAPSWYYARAHKLEAPKTHEDAMANERAVSLRKLREMAGLTQVAAAKAAGIEQPEVVRLEQAGDLKLSTLTKYLGGLGFRLQIVAQDADGARVHLELAKKPARSVTRVAAKATGRLVPRRRAS